MSVNQSETVLPPPPQTFATEKGESALITVIYLFIYYYYFLGGGGGRGVLFSCAQITIGDMLCRGGPRHIQLETSEMGDRGGKGVGWGGWRRE